MKSLFKNQILTVFAITSVLVGASIAWSEFSKNYVDDSGKKQGYWVITGSMVDDSTYDLDSKVEEGNFTDNLKTGKWVKYYASGEIRSEITYEANRPLGAYTLYYENGVVEEEGNWQRNKNVGKFIRNYSNGQPHQDFSFSDSGKRNGEQKYYHENGEVALLVNIVNGKESGIMKRYDTDGSLVEEKNFNGGEFVKGSTKKFKERPEDFVPAPVKVDETSDVQAETESSSDESTNAAHHFKPNGFNILYDQNKNVSQSGTFKNGRLWNGKWYKYNRDGILLRVDIYRSGKFIGHGLLEEDQ